MFIIKEYANKINEMPILSNEEALCQYVGYLNNVCQNEMALIKNVRCEFIAFTDSMAEEFNLGAEILGATFNAARDVSATIRENIRQQELKLLSDRNPQTSFYFYQKNSEIRNYLVRKRILLNHATNQAVGIFVSTERVLPNLHRKFLQREFLGMSNQLNVNTMPSLTSVQKQILFCLLIGISNRKEIAQTLTTITGSLISDVKVKNELQALYHEFHCSHSSKLTQLVLSEQIYLDLSELPIAPGNYLL
jgi:hypothetical protein